MAIVFFGGQCGGSLAGERKPGGAPNPFAAVCVVCVCVGRTHVCVCVCGWKAHSSENRASNGLFGRTETRERASVVTARMARAEPLFQPPARIQIEGTHSRARMSHRNTHTRTHSKNACIQAHSRRRFCIYVFFVLPQRLTSSVAQHRCTVARHQLVRCDMRKTHTHTHTTLEPKNTRRTHANRRGPESTHTARAHTRSTALAV